MAPEFEWDVQKATTNQKKHGVTFEEAATVVQRPAGGDFRTEAHSAVGTRKIIIGHSDRNRLLLVSFTERSKQIRIIHARRATKRENQDYEENR